VIVIKTAFSAEFNNLNQCLWWPVHIWIWRLIKLLVSSTVAVIKVPVMHKWLQIYLISMRQKSSGFWIVGQGCCLDLLGLQVVMANYNNSPATNTTLVIAEFTSENMWMPFFRNNASYLIWIRYRFNSVVW
jgi:hypothetical protein